MIRAKYEIRNTKYEKRPGLALAVISYFVFRISYLPLHGAFVDPYWSARVAALGGAFTALSDDASGTLYNPAGTVRVKSRESQFSYARIFAGLDEAELSLSQFAYVQPLGRRGAFGVAWGGLNAAKLYREDQAVAAYGYSLKKVLDRRGVLGGVGELSLGVSVRYMTRRFVLDERTSSDAVFASGNRNQAAAFDFHLYAEPDPEVLPGLSVGLSLRSLNQPNLGFRDRERLPREVVGGLLYRRKSLSLPFDVSLRGGELTPHMGVEAFLWEESLAARIGSDRDQAGGGLGVRHALSDNFSIVFDYAFLWPLRVEKTVGSHRATLGVRF